MDIPIKYVPKNDKIDVIKSLKEVEPLLTTVVKCYTVYKFIRIFI